MVVSCIKRESNLRIWRFSTAICVSHYSMFMLNFKQTFGKIAVGVQLSAFSLFYYY